MVRKHEEEIFSEVLKLKWEVSQRNIKVQLHKNLYNE
jgi:hypothetical protein